MATMSPSSAGAAFRGPECLPDEPPAPPGAGAGSATVTVKLAGMKCEAIRMRIYFHQKHTSGLAILASPLARINLSAQAEHSSRKSHTQIRRRVDYKNALSALPFC